MISATVVGNLGRDAEYKHVRSGDAVCEFTIASNRKIKGEDETTWVKCTIWGTRGEKLSPYLTKGKKVVVVGELSVREYEKRDGGTGHSVELRVDQLEFAGDKQASGSSRREPDPEPEPEQSGGGGFDEQSTDDDDIPFALNVSSEAAERWWR